LDARVEPDQRRMSSPPTAASLRFHFQTELGLEDLAILWRELHARADATTFLSWEWMSAWIAELGEMPPVLVGEAGGALVLLGLLVPRRRREAMGIIQVEGLHLHSTGTPEADIIAIEYNNFLVDRSWAGIAEREAVTWLLGSHLGKRRFDEVRLNSVVDRTASALLPQDVIVRELLRKPSWRVDLEAVRAAGGVYLDMLSANTRQQIRRAMRRYGQQGELVAERAADVAIALDWLDALSTLHQRRWEQKGQPGGWAFPFFAGFQRRLVENCVPKGMVEIVRISAGDHVIGYVYNLISRDHVMAFVTGFAMESDPRLKPGLVSHALCIQRHVEEGRRWYDFLAGEYRYKANLGQPGPEFVHLQIQRRTRMTLFESGVRSLWERARSRW
jgi:CelD/BcsL family acetyltransferase involved in cellulose biosynthesis